MQGNGIVGQPQNPQQPVMPQTNAQPMQQAQTMATTQATYQQNLPSLSTLASKEILDQNYFYRFALLIIIDEVFLRLYKKYVELKEKWED